MFRTTHFFHVLIGMFLCASLASAQVIRVPTDQATVAAAVAASSAGTEIRVANNINEGGALTLSGRELSIVSYDTGFTNPTAGAILGSVIVEASTVELNGLTIGNGQSTGAIGAVSLQNGQSTVTISGCTMTSADSFGVQVFNTATSSSLTMQNSGTVNNFLAGVRVDGNCIGLNLDLNGLTSTGNGQDGIVLLFGTPGVLNNHTISIGNSTFSGNGANGFGFGVALGQMSVPGVPTVVSNCTFTNNIGPALFIGWEADNPFIASQFDIDNCTMTGNTRGLDVNFLENSTVTLSNCAISNNSEFAAIADNITLGYLTPTTVVFESCTLSNSGLDGVLAIEGDWIFNDSHVDNNTNFGVSMGQPNAAVGRLNDRLFRATNSTFNGNGFDGLSAEGPERVTLTGCEFNNNFNGVLFGLPLNGATEAATETLVLDIDDCTFLDNNNFGLWCSTMNMEVEIADSRFVGNPTSPFVIEEIKGATATDANYLVNVNMERNVIRSGGNEGGHVSGDSWTVVNCLFDQGSANPGFTIFEDSLMTVAGGAAASALNCTFAHSNTGLTTPVTTAINVIEGTLDLQNSIVSLTDGAAVTLGANGTAGTIDYNLYQTASVGVSAGANSLPLGADPEFITPTTGAGAGNFFLQTTSPAVDAANAAIAPAVDINGTARPEGSGFDMGAYEGRVVTAVNQWMLY